MCKIEKYEKLVVEFYCYDCKVCICKLCVIEFYNIYDVEGIE